MPAYDYKCKDHGVFYELATIDDSDKPSQCPSCGAASARIIRIAPDTLTMSPALRKAAETNERSQCAPAFSTKARREEDDRHRSGCGCNKRSIGKSKLIFNAQGDKMFPSMRPWMISH